ncbi:hypothetical protein LTR56_012111 [Elasticomyces elasticus]|nr:hypothetical protein LTR56_012111 [Elasticomyces elasticus]KAK3665723.1 hypothetical protein LTR22_003354 [Elasticomyces elasticus]KAK4926358.1 hypothetical protein LTR49_006830 [Elasticomyces elasticus]KAK5757269.1 hypothetical protein LTS12_012627 [Elasticomyces elasticus]
MAFVYSRQTAVVAGETSVRTYSLLPGETDEGSKTPPPSFAPMSQSATESSSPAAPIRAESASPANGRDVHGTDMQELTKRNKAAGLKKRLQGGKGKGKGKGKAKGKTEGGAARAKAPAKRKRKGAAMSDFEVDDDEDVEMEDVWMEGKENVSPLRPRSGRGKAKGFYNGAELDTNPLSSPPRKKAPLRKKR